MAAFSWTDLIGPGMGLAGSLLGNQIQAGPAKANIKENARQFDIKTQRADAARAMLMPYLQRNLGGGAGLGAAPVARPAPYATSSAPAESGGGGGFSKVLKGAAGVAGSVLPAVLAKSASPVILNAAGVGGGGGGLGSMGGVLGALASNPATWLAAGGLGAFIAAKKIGQGRKAANRLTGPSGAQGEFGAVMQEIANREAAGQINPAQRQQMLSQALSEKVQQAISAAKNKNDVKVIKQWLGDFSKPEWMSGAPYLQPIAQQYLGSM